MSPLPLSLLDESNLLTLPNKYGKPHYFIYQHLEPKLVDLIQLALFSRAHDYKSRDIFVVDDRHPKYRRRGLRGVLFRAHQCNGVLPRLDQQKYQREQDRNAADWLTSDARSESVIW